MAKKRQHEKDREVREGVRRRHAEIWAALGVPEDACCGGYGLAVGCPSCGKKRK
jgi:hypothetical protein